MKSVAMLLVALAAFAPLRAEQEQTQQEVKPYPFDFCIVQEDEKLDPDAEPYAIVHEGQQYRFCCKDCWAEFRENPAPFVDKFKALLEKKAQEER
jgi:YHS domain-containing protein